MKVVPSGSGIGSLADEALDRANRAATAAADRATGSTLSTGFSKFSNTVARATGKPITFALSFLTIIAWGATGPFFQ